MSCFVAFYSAFSLEHGNAKVFLVDSEFGELAHQALAKVCLIDCLIICAFAWRRETFDCLGFIIR
jgi:hypothetical protein